MTFFHHERERGLVNQPKESPPRLTSESLCDRAAVAASDTSLAPALKRHRISSQREMTQCKQAVKRVFRVEVFVRPVAAESALRRPE